MSSIINQTTGECISGTCQVLDDVPMICAWILGFALICFIGWEILTLWTSRKSANQNHSQQPEVLTCQGEGEHTGVSKKTTGGLESGKSKQYPSADITDKVEGAK